MRKEDAEVLIVAELRKMFEGRQVGAMGGITEYHILKSKRPDLFDFQCSGDQWQVVQGWIKKHGLLDG